jgi:Flp pilus assembly protein CpaB
VRIALATRPLAYWTLTALIAGGIGYAVYGVAESAADARARYGTLRPALVARRALSPGDPLDATTAEVRHLPAALVAAGSLSALPVPPAVVATPIAAGEVVHRLRVGRGGDGPVAGLLPAGTRGVAIPLDETALPLRPGDRVDVVAAVAAGAGGSARVVAERAVVAYVAERSTVVAVAQAKVAAVAQAMADGGVLLALSAGP